RRGPKITAPALPAGAVRFHHAISDKHPHLRAHSRFVVSRKILAAVTCGTQLSLKSSYQIRIAGRPASDLAILPLERIQHASRSDRSFSRTGEPSASCDSGYATIRPNGKM